MFYYPFFYELVYSPFTTKQCDSHFIKNIKIFKLNFKFFIIASHLKWTCKECCMITLSENHFRLTRHVMSSFSLLLLTNRILCYDFALVGGGRFCHSHELLTWYFNTLTPFFQEIGGTVSEIPKQNESHHREDVPVGLSRQEFLLHDNIFTLMNLCPTSQSLRFLLFCIWACK